MKFLKAIFVISLILFRCSDDDTSKQQVLQWKKLGLDGKAVNEMHISGSTLYVATTTGLYQKQINTTDVGFILIGFDDKNVEALQVIDQQHLLASIFDKTGTEQPALYRTSDGGETWLALENHFGGDNPEPAFDFEVHPENENIIYATGYSVVAKSGDQGETWTPLYGDWGGFATGISVVEINPGDVNEIWAGGQGAIENGFLLRSRNQTDWDTWSDLVENPTVVKEITFADGNKEKLFVGFEGALLKTSDGGAHWQTLIQSEVNRFYFGIALSNGDPKRVYAGGWLKTNAEQPLILFISNNGGVSWRELKYSPEAYGGILDMQIKSQEDKDILYLGLDKGGVYEVTIAN